MEERQAQLDARFHDVHEVDDQEDGAIRVTSSRRAMAYAKTTMMQPARTPVTPATPVAPNGMTVLASSLTKPGDLPSLKRAIQVRRRRC